MLTLPCSVRIFVYTLPTDMRCGFNRLSMLAGSMMGKDPYSGHLFVFFNKYGDRCKILLWDRNGFCLWYKRLEKGTFARLNSPDSGTIELDITRLTLILEGIDLAKIKKRKRYIHKMPQIPLINQK